MQDKPVALVTGANQGIGLQIAKDLAAEGLTVLLGSRDLDRGKAAADAVGSNVVAVQLDVTDQTSIATAAAWIASEFGRLDVLIQNAGITSTSSEVRTPEEYGRAHKPSIVSLAEMRAIWDTNVFGVMAVYQAMVPILRQTPGSRIINLSSGSGSLTMVSDPNSPLRASFDTTYAASKTALNALTVAMAIELEPEGIRVNAVSPGYTRTKLNGFAGTDTVEQGAAEAVRLALLGADAPTGRFTHATFGDLPW